jgi:P4 family phage/plasmid primase-like protien
MKDKIQAAWIENTINILARMVNLPEQCWPDHPLLLNVQNGMVDMNGRKLVAHDPDFGSRTQLPVGFDPKAHAPRWLKFLKDVFPEDENMGKQFLLQQFFGYCLLKDCRYQKALFMYGTGANGKDTVLNVLQAMLGPKNVSNMTLSDLTQRFKASYLQNKLVNLSTETNTRDPIAMDMFKAVVGGGTITTERKYGEEFSFRPFCKFIAAMNTPPTIPDKSYGFTRRVIALYFRRRLEPHEIIGNMSELLIEEITGIFKWAMEGWSVLLSQGGFTIPEQVEEDTAAMITTLNPMLIFIQECCELIEKVDESTTEIWQAYLGWCTEGRNRPLGRNNFYDQLTQTFPSVKKIKAKDLNVFRGIQLNEKGREYAAAVRKRATRYDDHD